MTAPLRVRGLEKRIVLDATVAVGGGSVDISNVNSGVNVDVTQTTFDINGDSVPDQVYQFHVNNGTWNNGVTNLSGQVDLNGAAGPEAFVSGKDLYVSKSFLETNAGGMSVSGTGNGFIQMKTDVTTAGNQDYGVKVNVMQDVTLTGPNVTFTGVVNGQGHNLTIEGNAFFGDGAADTVTGVDVLHVTGTTTINTNTVTTDGTQTYDGAVTIGAPAGTATLSTTDDAVLFKSSVTLGSNLTVNSGTASTTFTGAVNGGKTLIVNSTGDTIFNGLVGGVTPLTALTTNAGGTTQINGGGIHTTGAQNFTDDVRVGTGTQSLSGSSVHFFEEVDGLAAGQGDLVIANTNTLTFDKPVGSINDLSSFKIAANDITFGTGTYVEVTGSAAESVHIVATGASGTLHLPAGFTVRAAYNGTSYDGVANTFAPRPSPGVADTALVELPAVPPTFTGTTNIDGSVTVTITLPIGNPGEKGMRVYVDWGDTSDPANRFEGPDGWADGDGLGANTGDLDGIDGGSTVTLTHTYTAAEVAAQQLVDNTFDVKYAVFQHEAIVIEASRLEQVGQSPIGVAGGPLIVLTTTMVFGGAGSHDEPPPAATNPSLVNGLVYVGIAAAPFGGGTVAVGGDSVDLSNFISGTTVTVTQADYDIDGDSNLDPVYVFTLNTGTWNDGVVNLAGPIDLNGVAGAEAYVNGGVLYVSKSFLESNPGGLSITGNGFDPTVILATDVTTAGNQDYQAEVELAQDVSLSAGAGNITFGDTVSGAFDLVINSTGTTTFNDAVGLASLTTDAGGQTVFAAGVGMVTTSETQDYGDSVILQDNLVMAATVATLAGGLTGGGNDLTIQGNAVLGDAASDAVTGLKTLHVSGETTINTNTVTTTGAQTYDLAVTVGAPAGLATLTTTNGAVTFGTTTTLASDLTVSTGNGDITWAGAINGGFDLVADSTGVTTFGAAVGNLNTLTSVTTNAGGTTEMNGGSLHTTGDQKYGDDVSLGAGTTLTSDAGVVQFLGTVTGDGKFLVIDGDAVFGDAATDTLTGLDTLHVTGMTTINTNTVTTSGTQAYDDAVTIGVPAGGATLTTTDRDVLFGSTVTLASDLTVSTGTGNITFTGAVNGGFDLIANSAGVTTFGGPVGSVNPLTSVTTNAGGTTEINGGSVKTLGDQLYGDDVQLGADTTLTGNLVTFNGQVTGQALYSLLIKGDALFGDAAGDKVTGLTTLHVTGETTINTNEVTTSGAQTYDQAVTIGIPAVSATLTTTNGTVSFGSTTTLKSDLTVDAGNGDITWSDAIDGGFDLVANSTGTTKFNGPVGSGTPLASVTTNPGGTTQINGGIVHTTGDQTYHDDVTLGANTTLTGVLATFDGKVTGTGGTSLDVVGQAVFGDAAGDAVTGLTTLHVTGETTINTSEVTTSGTQKYDDAVTIGLPAGVATLKTTDGAVTFGSTTTLKSNLTVDSGLGDVTFTGAVNGGQALLVNSTGTTKFSGPVGNLNPLASVTTNAGGTTHIDGGSVNTTGNQTYGDDVVLGANTTLTGDLVTFNGQVSAGATYSLKVVGDAVFGDAAGDKVTGLTTLEVTETTVINTNEVATSGTQTYTGTVKIGAPAALATLKTTNSAVSFGSTTTLESDLTVDTGNGNITWADAINGGFDLVANSTGTTKFSGPVGNLDPLASVTTNVGGTTEINGGVVHTTGDQTYHDDVKLGVDTTLTGVLITFEGTVTGQAPGHSLLIDGDAVFGNDAADFVTGLTTLEVTGTTEINTSTVSSTGTQTYQDNVTLGADTSLTGSTVAFNGQVIGGDNSLEIVGTAVFGDAAGDTVTGVDVLHVTGTTTINTNLVSTTGTQAYDQAVTVGSAAGTAVLETTDDAVLFGSTVGLSSNLTVHAGLGDVTFTGAVNGGKALIVNSTGLTTFAGPVGNATALSSVTTNAGGSTDIDGGSVRTTGDQLYGDDVQLGADTTLTGALVTFNGQVTGQNLDLLLINGNAVFGDAAADTVTGLTTLHVTGETTINTDTVTTSGTQAYDGAVTIGTPAVAATLTTTNSAVSFGSTTTLKSDLKVSTGNGDITWVDAIDGGFDLVANSTGTTEFGGAVGNLDPLSSLTTNAGGTTAINGGIVHTTGDQTYHDDVLLGANTTLTGGIVTFDGTVTGQAHSLLINGQAVLGDAAGDHVTDLTTLHVTGDTTINTETVTTSGKQTYDQAVTIGTPAGLATLSTTNSAVVFGSTTTLKSDLTVSTGNGDITWTGTVNGGFDLIANSTGTTKFGGAVGNIDALTSVTTNAGGTTEINGGSVKTSGDQAYHDDVSLGANTTLTGVLVTFDGTVTGNGKSLDIAGKAVFGNAAADTVTGLTTLHVSGTTTINTNTVTTSGTQTYDQAVTIGTPAGLATLTTTNSAVLFGSTTTLKSDLTVSTGNGDITWTGAIDGGFDLVANSAGVTKFGGAVGGLDPLTSVTTNAGGTTRINGGVVHTTGDQTYHDDVTLGANTVLTGALITFDGKVDGLTHSLLVDGKAVFGDSATDSVTGLTTLEVTGTTTINTNTVTSSGTQTYDDAVTIGLPAGLATLTTTNSDVLFKSTTTLKSDLTVSTGNGNITFTGAVNGGFNLNASSTSTTKFSAAVGNLNPLASVTTNAGGTTEINGGSVHTTGNQTYRDNVLLGADSTLTAALVRFEGTVDGQTHSLLISGNAVFGNDAADTVTGLTTLHVTGLSTINTTNIASASTQTYDGDVTLGENVTLTGSIVTFKSQVIGATHSLDVAGDAVFGDAAGDTVTGLTTLHVAGDTTVNTNTVTSSGTQAYDGDVTIGGTAGTAVLTTTDSAVLFGSTVTLLANLTVTTGTGPVTFTGGVDGGFDLVVNSTGDTTFNGDVGATTALHSLTTNAGGTTFINGGSVKTSLDETYGDDVKLGANATLTSLNGVVTFLGKVIGNGKSLDIVGDAVFGDEAGDTVTGLASLSVSETTVINTSTVTSSGSQTYTGDVTIGAPALLATLTTTDSPVFFGGTTTLKSDLTVTTGNGNITWTGAINGPFDLVANSTGTTIFNGLVGNLDRLSSVTTNAGGITEINGGGLHTTGNQLYGDDVQLGPGTQDLRGNVIHFFGGVDGRLDRQGDLNIAETNAVFFDKPIGAVRDPGSAKVSAVDITFADGTYIEVGKSAAESVHIVATGTLVLPVGFVVRAAYNGSDYDGVANTFLPRPAPGVADTALVELPASRPIFSSKQNPDQTATGTIELPIGNSGEKGLRVFVDWGDTVSQENRFEGPGGWADGDGKGDNNSPGDLYAIDGGSTISLTHTYTEAEIQAQLKIDNDFDVKYAVYQHEAIVIEAAKVVQGAESLGTPGGELTVLTTTMVSSDPLAARFEPPPASTVPDLVNGTVAVQLAPPVGSVPFEFPVARPEVAFAPNNESPPLNQIVTFQQVTKDESATSSPVVGRQQRFVLRLLSPDPTAPPIAEVELPPDSFNAKNLQLLFRELPDGAYEIDLLLGENTERPILRFDIRQGRPVVPQESLDGGQLRLEDIEETLKKNGAEPAKDSKDVDTSMGAIEEAPADGAPFTAESVEADRPDSEVTAEAENSSRPVRPAVTMSSLLEWKLRRREAVREGSLSLASRLARRVCS